MALFTSSGLCIWSSLGPDCSAGIHRNFPPKAQEQKR